MPKADYVFFATGVRSENSLVATAKKVCSKVYTVGDAEKAGTILKSLDFIDFTAFCSWLLYKNKEVTNIKK